MLEKTDNVLKLPVTEQLENLEDRVDDLEKKGGSSGGGGVDTRIDKLEDNVGKIQVDIATIKTQMPFLATKDTVQAIATQIPYLATKAEINGLKASLIQWMVSTVLASAGLAAVIAFGLARLIKG